MKRDMLTEIFHVHFTETLLHVSRFIIRGFPFASVNSRLVAGRNVRKVLFNGETLFQEDAPVLSSYLDFKQQPRQMKNHREAGKKTRIFGTDVIFYWRSG